VFIEFAPEKTSAISKTASPLSGLPFAFKDNIAVNNFSLSCGSKLLAELKAPVYGDCGAKTGRYGRVRNR
jgi:aspartyl-tRNA(Asn)/glutamyl-tRNA(Gln) amidotransferase subunit A